VVSPPVLPGSPQHAARMSPKGMQGGGAFPACFKVEEYFLVGRPD
jgi:hypothetical protein